MVATFQFAEYNGAGGTETLDPAHLDFGSVDQSGLVRANNPIIAGENSFEKVIRGKWGGTFNTINNMKVWRSAGTLGAGETMKAGVHTAFLQPSTDEMAANRDPGDFTVVTMPTTEGSALDPTPSGGLSAAGYSKYVYIQLQTTTSADPGDTETFTFTLQYDES